MRKSTRPLHVAIIGTRGFPSFYGGFETAVRWIVPFFAERGVKVDVYGRRNGVVSGVTMPENVKSIVTPGLDSTSLSTLSYGFTSAIHASFRRPDVALVMNVANGFWLPLLKMVGIKTMVNVDGIEWERGKWGRIARILFKTGARLTARHADALIFDSKEIQSFWKAKFNRDGIYIPYGGDENLGGEQLAELPYSNFVLVVARLVPENSIGEFLAAVPMINQDAAIVIVGGSTGDSFVNEIVELQSKDSRVHWLGHIKDDQFLATLWKSASAYFHGHTVGGTNPALVQAMALGTKIVARDTVYNREVLGGAGAYTDADPREIAQAINAMLEFGDSYSECAIERARSFYTWESVNSRYLEAARELARLEN